MVQNYSVVGFAIQDPNMVMDRAAAGELGGPAQWGDAFGDWLGQTVPSSWLASHF